MNFNVEDYLDIVMNTAFPLDTEFDKNCLYKLKNCTKATSNSCLDLIKVYHPSIWRCNVKNHLAPVDAWNSPEIMYKVIQNRLKYLSSDFLSSYNIRAGLSISKLAPKVSIFRPATAKYLIEKYLNEFDTIFDPCAGFSGRMLGTCSLNKKYIGQDINSVTVKEANNLIKDFNLNADYSYKNSIYDSGKYDCLFTCPPYGDKENWHQDIEPLTTEEWIEVCLNNYDCQKYLLVVDKTEKYKDFIVEEIKNNSHFGSNVEQVLLIDKRGV